MLAFVSIPTFCRPKSSKKAQHRQNQSLSSLLRNFAKQNILRSSLACRQLSLESHGSVKFGHTSCVRKFASLFRVFLQPLPVILTVLYFVEITFAMVIANLCNTNKVPPRLRGGGLVSHQASKDGGVLMFAFSCNPLPLRVLPL